MIKKKSSSVKIREICAPRITNKCDKNMNQEKPTNWKKLYIALLLITAVMIVAMLLFQNYYK